MPVKYVSDYKITNLTSRSRLFTTSTFGVSRIVNLYFTGHVLGGFVQVAYAIKNAALEALGLKLYFENPKMHSPIHEKIFNVTMIEFYRVKISDDNLQL